MIYRLSIDAFALSPEVAEVLKAVRDDRAFAKSRVNVLPGGLAAAASHYSETQTLQILFVEEDADEATLMHRLEVLAEVCDAGTHVVVIGGLNDIGFYRRLIGQGVGEYMLRPVTVGQVISVIDRMFEDPSAPSRGKAIAFWGARGGVGASTLAQNVAWSIGRLLGEQAIYLDLDIAFGSSLLAFNVDAKQTVVDALSNPDRLDEVLIERFLASYDDNVQVLASPADPKQTAPIDVDGLDRLVELCARMAPVVVVDLPHVWTPWTEHCLVAADEAVVVATPDLFCLRDTKTITEMLSAKRRDSAAPRLVLNKQDTAKRTQLSAKDFEETLGLAPSLVLPFDSVLFGTAANNGQMLAEATKTHKIVEQISGFAAQLAGRAPGDNKAKQKPKSPAANLLKWFKR